MNKQTLVLAASLAAATAILSACGGGGGGGSSSTGTTPGPGPGGGGTTTYTATCSDFTTRTSTTSVADAQAKCLVASVPPAVYSGTFAVEKKEVFDQLNADRFACGFGKVAQNTKLDVAAQGHADYLTINNLNTHVQTSGLPGFTGITHFDRFAAAGYSHSYGSEGASTTQSGTFYSSAGGLLPYGAAQVSARNNLRVLYSTVYHLMDMMRGQRDVGVGVALKDNSGGGFTAFVKRLVLDYGTSTGQINQQIAGNALVTFPCNGIANLNPYFYGETPDPFPLVNFNVTLYGQPVYITGASGTTVTLTSGTITLRGGAAVPTVQLNSSNDPQFILTSNQVFLVPTQPLASNATYDVVLAGTNTGMITTANPTGTWTRSFSFQTGTFTTN